MSTNSPQKVLHFTICVHSGKIVLSDIPQRWSESPDNDRIQSLESYQVHARQYYCFMNVVLNYTIDLPTLQNLRCEEHWSLKISFDPGSGGLTVRGGTNCDLKTDLIRFTNFIWLCITNSTVI